MKDLGNIFVKTQILRHFLLRINTIAHMVSRVSADQKAQTTGNHIKKKQMFIEYFVRHGLTSSGNCILSFPANLRDELINRARVLKRAREKTRANAGLEQIILQLQRVAKINSLQEKSLLQIAKV